LGHVGWIVASIPEVPGAHSQAGRARRRARTALFCERLWRPDPARAGRRGDRPSSFAKAANAAEYVRFGDIVRLGEGLEEAESQAKGAISADCERERHPNHVRDPR
jgi:hypothetical protein